ncbi:FAD/NAD(P)-binding domain-containing protein [Micromonospora sp. RL09-050-HVF-A]|uniref:FAD/NAD(P)-binding protein n=1 Tax=unclassified Micromonospora TaxID=2617518 RepID=UPI001C5DECF7|nr:FAD/NAD(P)-binding protein [Micromonospora sp. RL09-050-HVF-A]MBW4701797.1 FAD/NAD(P)-binding protein [Micromonospora sp. RL09-050-HVF-A]
MSTSDPLSVCVVGMGPRGLCVLERLVTNAAADPDRPVRIDVVDPYPPGAGRVWRADQSDRLLMNTVASQVTVFTDPTVELAGQLREGPSLYEWARFQVLMGDLAQFPSDVAEELRGVGPDTYSTRRLFGHYLTWVYHRVVATAPANVSVHAHATVAVAVWDESDGRQCVQLQTGDRLPGLDAVVLAQGHFPVTPTVQEQKLAEFAVERGLTYILPANPADVDLSMVRPGEPTLLRGLGLCFFDYLALLTEGRAGRYVRGDDGQLTYLPSGLEPQLLAGSRRGIPYRARGRNEKGAHGRHEPRVLTVELVERLRTAPDATPLDFMTDLWPLIAKEVETVFYVAVLRRRGCRGKARRFEAEYLAVPRGDGQEEQIRERYGITERWDWDAVLDPARDETFADPAALQEWMLRYLQEDADTAQEGNVSGPLKAAMDVLRDLRNEVRLAVDHGGLRGSSHRHHLDDWYTPMNAFLSIGPPAHRVEQLAALIRAGVLRVVGAGMRVSPCPEQGGFLVESPRTPGTRDVVTAMIEARLPEVDLRRTADPLLGWMLAHRSCTPHVVSDQEAQPHVTGGLAVTGRPFHPVTAAGERHARRFVFGVPTEGAHWATAAGARPGVNSVMLGDADAISLSVLALTVRATTTTGAVTT